MQGLLGVGFIVLVAWLISEDRRRIRWQTITVGLGLQFLLAALLIKVPLFTRVFVGLNSLVLALEQSARAGTAMVFGFLGGGPLPYAETAPGASYVLAFRALPLVLVISALAALLYHWRILPWVVRVFSLLLQKTMRINGPVGVAAAANIFVGMVEAPLLVRPYLSRLSRAELFMIMTCGMSTIAGTVLVLYASLLGGVLPDALGHILTASLISAPAALMISQVMIPGDQLDNIQITLPPSEARGAMDAVTRGTVDGLQLLLQIVAMLVVLVSLVALVNQMVGLLPDVYGAPLTLQRLLGWLLSPFCWLLGVSWDAAPVVGGLLGTKVVLNEFVAYLDLAALPSQALTAKNKLIAVYSLCGFANFGSLGIMLGGMGAMLPERRAEVVGLGMRSILAGMLSTCLTGAVVGVLVSM